MSLIINEYKNYIQIIKVIYKDEITLMNTMNISRKDIINIIL